MTTAEPDERRRAIQTSGSPIASSELVAEKTPWRPVVPAGGDQLLAAFSSLLDAAPAGDDVAERAGDVGERPRRGASPASVRPPS